MNEIFYFNEGETIKDIPLDLLSQSLMITDSKGRPPRNRPIQSWELVDTIDKLCKEAALDIEIQHIYVPAKDSTPVINRDEKVLYESGTNIPINKWLFNKVGIVVLLHHPEDGETVTSIAAAFHEKGIQIAWGQQVSMCSNFCIFGANAMYTFGEDSMPWEKVLEMMKAWIMQFDAKRAEDLAIIEGMKNFPISDNVLEFQLDAMVGNIYRAAVRKNYVASDTKFVFTMSQTSEFVQNLENKLRDHYQDVKAWEEETLEKGRLPIVSLWDLYNWGTEILKPEETDIANVFQVVTWWSKFLLNFMDYAGTVANNRVKSEEQVQEDIARHQEITGEVPPLDENHKLEERTEPFLLNPDDDEKIDKPSEPSIPETQDY